MSFNSQNNSEVPETHSRVTGEETEVLRHESFAISSQGGSGRAGGSIPVLATVRKGRKDRADRDETAQRTARETLGDGQGARGWRPGWWSL